MGLFQMACKTYDSLERRIGLQEDGKEPFAPIGHIITTANIEITVNKNGDFERAVIIDKKIPVPCTEKSSGRTSKAAATRPHPLCDKLSYLIKGNQDSYEAYISQLKAWAESNYSSSKLLPILNYILKGSILDDLISSKLIKTDSKDEKKSMDNIITWRVNGLGEDSGSVYDDIELQSNYYMYYLENIEPNDICMITGEKRKIASQHIKGISYLGSNAKLISANDETNFTYRGRFKNSNEAMNISYIASQKAHNALKWIISNQGVKIGERIMVCWNPNGIKVPDITLPLMFKDDELKSLNGYKDYKESLEKKLYGYKSKLNESEDVVIAAFEAATSGRLSTTYYNELQGSDFLDRMGNWDLSCCWNHGRYGIQSPTLYNIIKYAFGTQRGNDDSAQVEVDSKILKQQMQRIVSCRIDKVLFPSDIVKSIVGKSSNIQIYNKKNRAELLFVSCAIIRKFRKDHFGEEWKMALEKNKQDRSYQFGRLLAVLEKIERDTYAADEKRETNAIRSQAVYVQRPLLAFNQIMTQLKSAYYPRLNIGTRVFYDKLIGDIMEILSGFDSVEIGQPLKETYLMGYYLQKNDLYSKITKDENEEE